MQPVLNLKFIRIIKRLYLEFFALYILLALSVFVLPKNIDDNSVCVGFASLMKQFFKCRRSRDRSVRAACGVLCRCDAGG